MEIIIQPTVQVIAVPVLQMAAIADYLDGATWTATSASDAERLVEFAGRVCYASFGAQQGRHDSTAYLERILAAGHGSVLEHATWSVLISGVSRSLTHELVRHRAGVAFSQASQRYIATHDAVVAPPALLADPDLLEQWADQMATAQFVYRSLVDRLAAQVATASPGLSVRARRKLVREAARSVLPNATATTLVMTANARALRHICLLRGNPDADAEMRRFAVALFRAIQLGAPALFQDMAVTLLADGSEQVIGQYHKV